MALSIFLLCSSFCCLNFISDLRVKCLLRCLIILGSWKHTSNWYLETQGRDFWGMLVVVEQQSLSVDDFIVNWWGRDLAIYSWDHQRSMAVDLSLSWASQFPQRGILQSLVWVGCIKLTSSVWELNRKSELGAHSSAGKLSPNLLLSVLEYHPSLPCAWYPQGPASFALKIWKD